VASDEWRVARDEWRVAKKSKKLGGNADVFENRGVAKKAICKWMKTRGMQIDGAEVAIRKFLKTRADKIPSAGLNS
jgi:hypothetical protein